ncbi:MAG: FecR domain-containing protein [Sandaracinaceae bacterium]
MSALPDPIRDVVDVGLDEAALRDGWRRVSDGRTARARARRRTVIVGGVALAVAAALALFLVPRSDARLELADGRAMPARVDAEAARTVELSDGTRIELAASSALSVLTNDPGRIELVLERGSAHFDVVHTGERRWIVEAGFASVEVVGTRFTVDRDQRSVAVERGRVIVRSDRLPDRVRALGAGESWTADAVGEAATRGGIAPAEVDAPGRRAAPHATDPGVPRDDDGPRADEPTGPAGGAGDDEGSSADEPHDPTGGAGDDQGPSADEPHDPTGGAGDDEGSRADEPRDPLEPSSAPRQERAPSASELLDRADEARAAGRVEEGLQLLARAARMPGQEGLLAAITRARWELDLGRVAAARADLARASRRPSPGPLRELLLAYSVEAHARAGDRASAERASAEYDARFPQGRFRAANARWLGTLSP